MRATTKLTSTNEMSAQVPALFRSKASASDQISIVINRAKICYMFESDFEQGSGPLFESEKVAKECVPEGTKIVKVSVNLA